MQNPVTQSYENNAIRLASQYEKLTFEDIHRSWIHLLPSGRGHVLDIGAGSGRDAGWLARNGYQVVAAEPVKIFRQLARINHGEQDIQWLDDQLPNLEAVRRLNLLFDLILLSAVWMHVAPEDRESALRYITNLLRPAGLAVFTLRQGPAPKDRPMYPVLAEELVAQAISEGLEPVLVTDSQDQMQRTGIWWQTVVLHKL